MSLLFILNIISEGKTMNKRKRKKRNARKRRNMQDTYSLTAKLKKYCSHYDENMDTSYFITNVTSKKLLKDTIDFSYVFIAVTDILDKKDLSAQEIKLTLSDGSERIMMTSGFRDISDYINCFPEICRFSTSPGFEFVLHTLSCDSKFIDIHRIILINFLQESGAYNVDRYNQYYDKCIDYMCSNGLDTPDYHPSDKTSGRIVRFVTDKDTGIKYSIGDVEKLTKYGLLIRKCTINFLFDFFAATSLYYKDLNTLGDKDISLYLSSIPSFKRMFPIMLYLIKYYSLKAVTMMCESYIDIFTNLSREDARKIVRARVDRIVNLSNKTE